MNQTNPLPSPVSSYDSQSRRMSTVQQPGQPCFPSSPQHEQQSQSPSHHHHHHHHQQQQQQPRDQPPQQHPQQAPRGLGLYPGSMPPPQQSTVSPVMASPHSEWSHQQPHSAAEQQSEYASSQPPDIFSAAFDPFSGFSTASNTGGMVGTHSPEAPGLEFCQTPPSSNVQSHRGSVSSYAPSDSGSNGGAYTPRTKHDEQAGEWYTAGSNDLQRAISQAPMPYPTGGAPAMGSQTEQLYREHQPDALYRPQHHEWSKNDTHGYITELSASADGRARFDSMQPVLPSASRVRKRRQRTTPEEATHECRTCGKLFKRSYNWKSHMETHNPDRKYPHPCTHMVGSSQCTKKFQRKTDLDRHVDSVHLKSRNHKCSLCGNRFARRDTLRRHTEDGCPKRFELNIREQQANAAAMPSATTAPMHAPPPPQQQQQQPPQQRWSYSGPTTTAFPPRERSFSQASPMGPPPPGPYSFAPQHAPAAVYQT